MQGFLPIVKAIRRKTQVQHDSISEKWRLSIIFFQHFLPHNPGRGQQTSIWHQLQRCRGHNSFCSFSSPPPPASAFTNHHLPCPLLLRLSQILLHLLRPLPSPPRPRPPPHLPSATRQWSPFLQAFQMFAHLWNKHVSFSIIQCIVSSEGALYVMMT